MLKSLLPAFLSLSIAGSAYAGYDFTAADQAFLTKRMSGTNDQEKYQSTSDVRSMYETALKSSLTTDERVYATVQIGRLDLLRAGFLNGIDKKIRRKALESCIKIANEISNTQRQEYYYVYVACVALRGKLASGFLDRAVYGLKLSSIENAALEATKVDNKYIGGFEAGGILRIMAAVRGNPKADRLGLYNPTQGVEYARTALSSRKKSHPPFENRYSGKDFIENYYYYGQAVIALGLEKKEIETVLAGSQILSKKIAEVKANEDSLSTERKPERTQYMRVMGELIAKVQTCIDRTDWASCLSKEMQKED